MHPADLKSILLTIMGIGSIATDAAFGTEIKTLVGAYAPQVLAGVGLASAIAAQVYRVKYAPSTVEETPKS